MTERQLQRREGDMTKYCVDRVDHILPACTRDRSRNGRVDRLITDRFQKLSKTLEMIMTC